MRKEIANLWKLIEPVAQAAGFDLVELEWGREGGGWVLRLFIDRPFAAELDPAPRLPGASVPDPLLAEPTVGLEECERMSRDVSASLDVADVIKHPYRLEVSSPGLERPLRREKDFRRFAGRNVKIRTNSPVGGRRNFSGTLVNATGGVVEVLCDDQSCRVPIDDIARANLVPDWDAEFRRAGTQAAAPQARQQARKKDPSSNAGRGAGERDRGSPRSAS
jgi:ribosome maturation factor RimP